MKWPGGNNESLEQSLTSRQLIVTKGFMVQFEVRIVAGLFKLRHLDVMKYVSDNDVMATF